jgi:hypothetical protein
MGLALNTVMSNYRKQLSEAIGQNRTIKFLIFDLESPAPTLEILERSLGMGDSIEDLKRAFKRVLAFAKQYAQTGKVEVRLFDAIPTFGAVAIDRDENRGFLIVELNCYSSPGEECPSLRLEKKPGGLFHIYDRQITNLWNAATRAQLDDGKKDIG